jgi:hypothetical protein
MNPEPGATTTVAAGGFLVFPTDNAWLHHYPDLGEMLLHPHGGEVAVECFDSEGFRVVFELNGQGRPVSARRTAELPDEQELTQRIDTVIGQGRARLQGVANDGLPDVLLLLDMLAGRTYAELFEVLRRVPFGHGLPDEPNDRDWVHNCFTHGDCI